MSESIQNFARGCLSKSAYNDFDAAVSTIRRVKQQYGYDLVPYLCPHCMKYHLTKSREGKDVSKSFIKKQPVEMKKKPKVDHSEEIKNLKKRLSVVRVTLLYDKDIDKYGLCEEMRLLKEKIQILRKMN